MADALTPENQALLAQLPEPKNVFKHLLICMQVPRPSSKLDAIRAKLIEVAKLSSFETKIDSAGNLLIRKAASPGYENRTKVVLQAHLDMVTSKIKTSNHDFDKDPIRGKVVGDFLLADGTTLGADNAIGVAAAMAILEDATLKHGPLEAILTADEETTMSGAEFMDQAPFLHSSVLLNLDSEEEHSICVGCAGGFEKQFFVKAKREALSAQEISASSLVTVGVEGLFGGHTGIDIHKGRANALQLIARTLNHARLQGQNFRIHSLSGGNAANAIPRDAKVELFMLSKDTATFESVVMAYAEVLKTEFQYTEQEKKGEHKTEEKASTIGMKFLVHHKSASEAKDVSPTPCTAASSQLVVDGMLSMPHGVIRMNPEVEGTVDTSISFSLASLPAYPIDTSNAEAVANSSKCVLHLFCRSSSEHQMIEYDRKLDALARLGNENFIAGERFNFFPGWDPDLSTSAFQQTKEAHKDLFKDEPRVYAVHAGLECGLIQGRYPTMKCVSIGPTIENAHSPDEKLKLSSVAPFYNWLRRIVERLGEVVDGKH